MIRIGRENPPVTGLFLGSGKRAGTDLIAVVEYDSSAFKI